MSDLATCSAAQVHFVRLPRHCIQPPHGLGWLRNFFPSRDITGLEAREPGAAVESSKGRLAMTTDEQLMLEFQGGSKEAFTEALRPLP